MRDKTKTKEAIEAKIREILSKDARFRDAKIQVVLKSKLNEKL